MIALLSYLLGFSFFRTPGIAYALRRLGAAKKRNRLRAERGQSVTVGGKKISAAAYRRRFGTGRRKRSRSRRSRSRARR